jgi:hypothetical protein
MEINVYDHQHQTNLVQYDKLHEHNEDKLMKMYQYSYFQIHFHLYYDVYKLLNQELLNFLIKHDKNELLLLSHNRKQFGLDQMYTKIILNIRFSLKIYFLYLSEINRTWILNKFIRILNKLLKSINKFRTISTTIFSIIKF